MENIFAIYGYAIVIYCDFSGYSDVALGIAKWLGFNIPTNFLSPYQSLNITDFWRRWHISLSSWLKDYLYIPLGGNRRASFATYLFMVIFFIACYFAVTSLFHFKPLVAFWVCGIIFLIMVLPSVIEKKPSGIATNFNLMTTMLLGGLWHGANWNFIVWGILHGLGLSVHKIWMLKTDNAFGKLKRAIGYKVLSWVITFHFVCLCWVFFKSPDFDSALTMIHQVVHNFSFDVWGGFFEHYKMVIVMVSLGFFMHAIPDDYAERFYPNISKAPLAFYMIIFFVFVLIYGFFKSADPVMPIYLQF
jgi:D-alanyl-lipoteichoic acid acyltransferase DltB (MBOAT superfamily)